ncbi:MAG: DUF5703 domain-containing protein [Bryobacteraceae bacterium]
MGNLSRNRTSSGLLVAILAAFSAWAQRPDLSAYNIVWTNQSKNAGESMPCGGGDIGLNVWVENGDILFYMSRSGAFDENNGFPKFGRMRIRLSPNPFDGGSRFQQQLKLEQGSVEIVGEKQGQRVQVDIWVDVHSPVIHVDINSRTPVSAEALYESWRTADREDLPGEAESHRSYLGAPVKAIERKDNVAFRDNDILAFHRNQDNGTAFDLCVRQQGLDKVKDRMWNPLKDLTFGLLVRGRNMTPDGQEAGKYASTGFTAWRLKSKTPATRHEVRIYLHIDSPRDLQDWTRGLYRIVENDEKDGAAARDRTLAWWREFWGRSYIAISPGAAKPDRQEWRIGRNYQLFRYQLAANAYGAYPTKFNGGLFTYDPEFVIPNLLFNPDYRRWGGGSFTAQNQRLVYWPMLKSGDFDMMAAQFDFYLRALKNAEIRTEVYWGHRGASFTEQMENFGLPVASEYGWKRPAMDAGVEDNRWIEYLWDTSLEFCLMILDVERFTGADISKYMPLIESCPIFFDEHYQQHLQKTEGRAVDENGHLVLYPGTACETYKGTVNSVVTATALKTVVSRILELPSKYLTAEKKTYYQAFLARVPPIAFREVGGHKTIAPAQLFDRIQNVEIPQLYPVFPYGTYGIGRPDLQVAIDTWRYGVETPQQKNYISWHQDAIFCARLGLTEEAAAITARKLDDSGRRWPTFWGPGHDWVPDHNWGGSGMIGLQEMLMQTVDDKIYVWPAWPRNWDVEFRLHAPYGTVVEGSLEGGRIRRLTTTPASRASAVVVPAWSR